MTLASHAATAGISTSYLNDIEHDRTIPSLSRLQRVASALGMNASQILDGVRTFGEA